MLILLSRAEKLIGSYNLSSVFLLIESMSKGRKKNIFIPLIFTFNFFEKFYYQYWHFHYFNWIFNLLHTISRKKLFKDSKQFNELAVYSLCLQGMRIKFVQEETGTCQCFRKCILRQITWSRMHYFSPC